MKRISIGTLQCGPCKVILVILLIFALLVIFRYIDVSTFRYIGSIVFPEKATPESLKQKYENGSIKILIVPGHDKESYGAQYRGVTEESLNAQTGHYLYNYFFGDLKFFPHTTRSYQGNYSEWFVSYLKSGETEIKSWKDALKSAMRSFLRSGTVIKNVKIQHNPAADNASLNLYAVNKWSNENNIDIVLHLHFNDYPGHTYDMPGKYKGFAIYIPERQLPNYKVSKEIAESIKNELLKIQRSSNYPKEKNIIIEDQQLIAVGSNASRDGVSIVIEYGYIYEDKIYNKNLREQTLVDLAYYTYLGVKNFFEN